MESAVGVHTLRHTFATQAVASGVPLSVVSRQLGHADVRTTMRYAHHAHELTPGIFDRLSDGDQDDARRWFLHGVLNFIWQLERGLVESWEAVLRCEQSLPLTAEQREIAGPLGADDERVEFSIDSSTTWSSIVCRRPIPSIPSASAVVFAW